MKQILADQPILVSQINQFLKRGFLLFFGQYFFLCLMLYYIFLFTELLLYAKYFVYMILINLLNPVSYVTNLVSPF